MPNVRFILGATLLAVLVPSSTLAEEPFADFLHGLQNRGYGKLAIQYVDEISKRSDLPEEVRATLDLERAASLQVAAEETDNSDEAAQFVADARRNLDTFLGAHPEHSQAATAYATYGDLSFNRGISRLRVALLTQLAEQQVPLFGEARAAFEESRPRYTKAVELYQARLAAMIEEAAAQTEPPRGRRAEQAARERARRQEELESNWLDARFKLASVDYQIGRTHPDPMDAARKPALEAAAAGYDAIYQDFRVYRTGLYAHMWHGKTLEELGDFQTALDIYDEVLVNAPETGNEVEDDPAFSALFAEVEHFRLIILAKQLSPAAVIAEAEEWMQQNREVRLAPGYQGVAMELAKAKIAVAKTLTAPSEQRKAFQEVVASLADVARINSEHQQDAILLRREYASQAGDAEFGTFAEAMAVGDSAATGGAWDEALVAYAGAAAMADQTKSPDDAARARLQLARAQFFTGKAAESLETAESLARDLPDTPSAPAAAALAVNSALSLYVAAQDKAPAQQRLLAIADYTVERWPDHSEADDARLALGKLKIVQGDLPAAIAVFEGVNPASDRYPQALYLAAQTHWRTYIEEKKRSAGVAPSDELLALRTKIEGQLTTSLVAQRQGLAAEATLPRPAMEAQLLLADVYLDSGRGAEAVPLVEPILAAFRAEPPALDSFVIRSFMAAVKSNVAAGRLEQAAASAGALMEMADDSPQVNAVLVDFVKLLKTELRPPAEGQTAAAIANPGATAPPDSRQLLAPLLEQLAARQQLSLAGMVFVGDASAELGLRDAARTQYQRILTTAEQAPSQSKEAAAAVTRVRAQLVGLLRAEEKYGEAFTEVEKLIKEHPNALEPLMERGRILQGWAKSEPKRYAAATAEWTKLRTRLSRLAKKPPEYYEAIYNAAFCLIGEAQAGGDKANVAKAQQLLKSTLVLSPNLSGPEMVDRYKALLEESRSLAGKNG